MHRQIEPQRTHMELADHSVRALLCSPSTGLHTLAQSPTRLQRKQAVAKRVNDLQKKITDRRAVEAANADLAWGHRSHSALVHMVHLGLIPKTSYYAESALPFHTCSAGKRLGLAFCLRPSPPSAGVNFVATNDDNYKASSAMFSTCCANYANLLACPTSHQAGAAEKAVDLCKATARAWVQGAGLD